jgi:hypothetical protein
LIRTIPDDKDLKDRIMQALRVKPHTSEELAGQLGTSDRTIRRRLEHLPVIAKMDKGRKLYSPAFPEAQPTITEAIIVPTDDRSEEPQKPVSVTVCDNSVTGKKDESVTVTFTMYVDYFRANPERGITILDLIQHFHVKPEAVRQGLSRVERRGPVRRIAPGLYQYDSTKEQGNLHSVLRSGNWKFENVVLVTKGTRYSVLSRSEPSTEPGKNHECDTENMPIPTPGPDCIPHPDWPGMDLPTGQKIRQWLYPKTGTEWITISTNGAPPIDPGYLIFITENILRDHGFNPAKWDVSCVEYLIDSEKIRFEGTHTYQAFKNEVFKGYNHGYYGRFEKADRHTIPATEFIETCRILASGTLNTQTIREVRSLKNEVEELGKIARTAYSIADKERDIRIEAKRSTKKQNPPATFTPASALRQHPAPASQRAGP